MVHDDIWTNDLRQIAAKFVPICWKMMRTKPTYFVQGPTRTGHKGKRLLFYVQNRRRKLGLCLWPRNTATFIPVEESSSCHPRELRQMKSHFKIMLSIFFNSEANLHSMWVGCLRTYGRYVMLRSTVVIKGEICEVCVCAHVSIRPSKMEWSCCVRYGSSVSQFSDWAKTAVSRGELGCFSQMSSCV